MTHAADPLFEQLKRGALTKCRHYNGCINERCRAEVRYDDVKEHPAPGKPLRLPCILEGTFSGPDLPCEKRSIPTEAEAIAETMETVARLYENAEARRHAKEDARAKGYGKGHGGRGEVPCSRCKTGRLRYSVASYNGHMHGVCTTPDCVRWME